jgi:tRNA-dihydrouridine synthase A
VSVKLRIGVDSHDDYGFFRDFVLRLHEEAGVQRFVVHARKALLDGLTTTRQNRVDEIVPLRYDWVYRLKREHPQLHVELNGGVKTYHDVYDHLNAGVDGVMLGRVARDNPFFFAAADAVVFGEPDANKGRSLLAARVDVLRAYAEYATWEQQERGVSREVLLIPTNQILEGLSHAKRAFATSLRGTPRNARPDRFGDEILNALHSLEASGNATPPSKSRKVGGERKKQKRRGS